ncbi:hypothetical protein Tco_0297797, partial [Tanacetum coccineum]
MTPNSFDDSQNFPDHPAYYEPIWCDICGNDARYGHYCTPQVQDVEASSIPLKDSIMSELPPCVAITPALYTDEPVDSLIIEDEHLDTIPETESDEFIKSSVENLIQDPSESEGE